MSAATGAHPDLVRSDFVTGLVNAHAVEKQARELIEAQIKRSRAYPDVEARLRRHLDETNRQEERLDRLLARFDESRSVFKDTMMSVSAVMTSMAHAAADDEILKNTFANAAFENYEIAAYQSLIAMAEHLGIDDAVGPLRESLEEEKAMAAWVQENVPAVTRRYLELKAASARAGA
jgi:ferritin-like metal-binding protein YciE